MENSTVTAPAIVITPEALLEHWRGHRRLTRRVIETFPEKELFSYSIGGMRPFAKLAAEIMELAGSGMEGLVTGQWKKIAELDYNTKKGAETKEELLRQWDEVTAQIDELWPRLTPERFQENVAAFGMYEGPVWSNIFYWIDNENHHRGQGYVYLRGLGIEPPPFWDR